MNKISLILALVLFSLSFSLVAQETLRIGGLNEASYIYRTAPDSLNSYFRNSFNFNLAYRNFGFGMTFNAELPKYSNTQSELLEDISSQSLKLGWREIYAYYHKDSFKIHAGTLTETFGSGMIFRSWEDLEFDQDNRIDGFLMRYDSVLKLKTLYGALPSANDPEKYDLAYGADAEYPILSFLRMGASAISYRTFGYINPITMKDVYDQRDILGARTSVSFDALEINAEYAHSERYVPNQSTKAKGDALYANASYFLHPFQVGTAYKKYDSFGYRLQDLPLANYHNETLADNQASGIDEEGFQAWFSWEILDNLSFKADYAEAWNKAKDKKMNDIYTTMDWYIGSTLIAVEYAQIEKINETLSQWQTENIPSLQIGTDVWGNYVTFKAEYKYLEKQVFEKVSSHYEPKLQTDLTLGKLSMSLGVQSSWEDISELGSAVYSTNVELKYPVFEHSDLTFFAGKDAGGKICRNGICRYVAPFQGLKLELSTRF